MALLYYKQLRDIRQHTNDMILKNNEKMKAWTSDILKGPMFKTLVYKTLICYFQVERLLMAYRVAYK